MNKIPNRLPKPSSVLDLQTTKHPSPVLPTSFCAKRSILKFKSLKGRLMMPTIKEETNNTSNCNKENKDKNCSNKKSSTEKIDNQTKKGNSSLATKLSSKLSAKDKSVDSTKTSRSFVNQEKDKNSQSTKVGQFEIKQTKSSQAKIKSDSVKQESKIKINQLNGGQNKSTSKEDSNLNKKDSKIVSKIQTPKKSFSKQSSIEESAKQPNLIKRKSLINFERKKSPIDNKLKLQVNNQTDKNQTDKIKDEKNDHLIQSQNNQIREEPSQNSNERSSVDQICRICLDTIHVDGSESAADSTIKNQSSYLSPCKCKGQSKFVHRKCLNEWIYVSKRTSCQVCLVKFNNIKINVHKKSIIKWLTDEYDHLFMLILYLIPFLIDCILIFNFLNCDLIYVPVKSELNDKTILNQTDLNATFNDQLNNTSNVSSLERRNENENSSMFSSFISFKRTRNLSRTMSLNMLIFNLYFLEIKFFLKGYSLCLTGIPITLLLSFPSLILFIRYCKSRYEEWQAENLEIEIDN